MKKKNHYRHEGMFKGAPAEIFQRAEQLRKNMTVAESLLWERVKEDQLGVKFRRQHPIQLYIVDFYCHKFRLVIEVDGDYHYSSKQILKDKKRRSDLESLGIEVIRFRNEEIISKIDFVLKAIREKLGTSTTI